MSAPSADRNVLFGILALQMDFVTRDQLVAGMNAWVLDKAKPLGQILVDQGMLDPADRSLIDTMVERHVDRHGGDVEASLAAVPGAGWIRPHLASIVDTDLERSLGALVSGIPPPPTVAAPVSDREDTASWEGNVFTLTSRLRVLRRHAKGGLGEVYLARGEALGAAGGAQADAGPAGRRSAVARPVLGRGRDHGGT